MTAWLLIVTLATGETGPVPVDSAAICRQVAAAIAAGATVTAELADGREVEIVQAVCLEGEEART